MKNLISEARKEKFLSRKLWMSLGGILITWLIYFHTVGYFREFKEPELVNAIVSMYTTTQWIISAIILGYLGINGLQTWKHGSVVSNVIENIASVQNVRYPKEEDYTLDEQ